MSAVRPLSRWIPLVPALAALLLASAGSAAAVDPLPQLLTDENTPMRAIRERVGALGAAGCPTLSAYAGAPDPRTRERAVAALDEAGCDQLEDYRDFFADRSAWVVRAVALALARHRIAGGVPFLVAHLQDRRRLVSEGESVEIAVTAEQGLRRLTAQPIEPEGTARDASGGRETLLAAAWRAWQREHGAEPASRWLADGRSAIRAALAAGSPKARYAALETLALVGEPVDDLLVEALKRRPGEITAALQCAPDEPPRVTEQVPCTLTLRNDATRRIPLALGDIDLRLGPVAATSEASTAAAGKSAEAKGSRPSGKDTKKHPDTAAPPVPPPPPAPPRPAPEQVAAGLVDLAPGEVLRRPVNVGPVTTAGRYEAIASFEDLGRRLDPAAFPTDLRLEATLLLRFEQ
ncbi:MAG TPA: hypothetical protein VGS03_04075 [Candidatus Polarisedimenticolia bacterium]|jgi:hypothetical protein|nr:hypothetical protein [Candidatus Polarisedimenticolia bacterium]